MSKIQALQLFDFEDTNTYALFNPIPMQYLGSKARISRWLLDQIRNEFPATTTFCDLFAGTGSVSLRANESGYRIISNDIQPYSYIVLKSLFQESRVGLDKISKDIKNLSGDSYLLAGSRFDAYDLLHQERFYFQTAKNNNWRWEQYKDFCESTNLIKGLPNDEGQIKKENKWNLFINYYANTYFGVEQCLQLDALREYAQNLTLESEMVHVLAAAITAMTYAVSSTTHLAQYLKPTSKVRGLHLVKRRGMSLIEEVSKRLINLATFPLPKQVANVYQYDFRSALHNISYDKNTVVYVDPPYFKEHYSRYYHVLDTFYLYDYPLLTFNKRLDSTTIGRYRQDRIISDFGLRGSVKKAFSDLFTDIHNHKAKIAISYANTSLIDKNQLISLAKEANLTGQVKEVRLMHSGQGQPRNKYVSEYLFLLQG